MKRSASRERCGSGAFLVIIVVLVLVVACLGLAQMNFSRQVVGHVRRTAIGEIGLLLAESAVQEALHDVLRRVNDPTDRLFTRIRDELLSSSTGVFDVDIDVPALRSMLERPQYGAYGLDRLSVQVTMQRLFTRVPYEKYGVVACSATVSRRLGLTDRIRRTVRAGCEFKVALLAPPRPFDQVTFMVTDSDYLTQGANDKIRASLRELDEARQDRAAVVERLLAADSAAARAGAAALRSCDIPSRRTLRRRIHEFDEPLTVFSVQPIVELRRVDLPRQLEAATTVVDETRQRYGLAYRVLQQNVSSEAAIDGYREALGAWVAANRARLEAVRSFQNAFVEFSGRPRDRFADFFYKLDQTEWRAKAFYRLDEGAGDINGQLDGLRGLIMPLNGVVYIDNPTTTLDLERRRGIFDGRVVIVTTGNVVIGDVPDGGEADDLLTLVSFGSVSVRGSCRAAILANRRLAVAPGARIVGNLVLREVRSFGALEGSVAYDGKIHSGRTKAGDAAGAFPDYYYVAMAPGETFQGVERR